MTARDAAIAAAAAGAAIAGLAIESSEAFADAVQAPDVIGWVLMVVVGAAAVLRRSVPLLAGSICLIGYTLAAGLGYASFVTSLIAAGVLGSSAAHASRRATIGLGVGSTALAVLLMVIQSRSWPVQVTDVVDALAFAIVPVALGDAFRSHHRLAREALERADRLEQMRSLELERAVTEERLRIAREVHDIVGHRVSAAAIQIGLGEQWVRTGDSARASEALRLARLLASTALRETQQSIRLMRSATDDVPDLATPGLTALDALAETAGHSGVQVAIRREGDLTAVPAMVDACAYRIVQEALTNVVRHAGARNADVVIRGCDDRLELTVLDDGRGGAHRPGNGLSGMRERAALTGGTMVAGPVDAGGWRVDATLPLGDRPR